MELNTALKLGMLGRGSEQELVAGGRLYGRAYIHCTKYGGFLASCAVDY